MSSFNESLFDLGSKSRISKRVKSQLGADSVSYNKDRYFLESHERRERIKSAIETEFQVKRSRNELHDHSCSRHENLDLHQFLRNTKKSALAAEDLGFLDDVLCSAMTCPMCRLVGHVSRTFLSSQIVRTGALGCHIVRTKLEYSHHNGYSPTTQLEDNSDTHAATLLLYGMKIDENHIPMNLGCSLQLLSVDQDPAKSFLQSRQVGLQMNVELLRFWVSTCQSGHGDVCESLGWASTSELHIPHFRLIDIRNRVVVNTSIQYKYIALSYVWGHASKQFFISTKHNSIDSRGEPKELRLPHRLPKTIEDAMSLTQALRVDYLWVDALCIIQDNHSTKDAQISSMDLVYASAIMTIAAADGDDVQAGLPGLRTRVQYQKIEEINGVKVANKLPSSVESINSSTWNSRAWTFQERILSKRCLILTKFQAFYQCCQEVWCEDTYAENEDCQPSPLIRGRHLQIFQPAASPEDYNHAFEIYAHIIASYTVKSLTFQADILRALSGALRLLERKFSVKFLWGLPDRRLDYALLWQPCQPLPIRNCSGVNRYLRWTGYGPNDAMYPSWSWAAWLGKVMYQPDSSTMSETRQKLVWFSEHNIISEGQAPNPLYYELDVQMTGTEPEESNLPRSSLENGVLRFWTTAAKFDGKFDVKFEPYDSVPGPHKISDGGTLRNVLLVDRKGIEAGEIILDKTLPLSESGNLEFIVISLAKRTKRTVWNSGWGGRVGKGTSVQFDTSTGNLGKKDWEEEDKPWSSYNVMLVTRRHRFSYRIGVGTIHVDAWKFANPTWQLIELA